MPDPIIGEATIRLDTNIERVLIDMGNTRQGIDSVTVANNANLRVMLRSWLIAKGVPDDKVRTASDHVLANAFKAGDRYVAKMMTDPSESPFGDFSKAKPTRFAETRRGGLALDDAFDNIFEPKPEPAPAWNGPEITMTEPASITAPAPKLDSTVLNALQSRGIDPEALARAAAKVIEPRLNEAKAALRKEIENHAVTTTNTLGAAVERRWTEALRTFETKTNGLVDGLRDDLFKYVDQSLPREIHIKQDNKLVRALPREARHKAFDIGLQWLMAGQHLYGVGPAGTGKTHLFKQWGEALGREVHLVGQALSKYDISGYKGPTGEYFGTVVRDALERGGLLAIDEGDMWAAAALGFLNAPLANGWCSFPDKTIEVHPDFQCIITANTFGRGATQEYIGRNPLDAASIDRFAYIIIDYDEDLECQLYGNGPWTKYVQRVRAAITQLRLQHIVSMRATQRLNAGIAAGIDPDQALFSSVWRGLAPDSIAKIKSIVGDPPSRTVFVPDEDDFSLSLETHAIFDKIIKYNLELSLQNLRNLYYSEDTIHDSFESPEEFTKALLDYHKVQTKSPSWAL